MATIIIDGYVITGTPKEIDELVKLQANKCFYSSNGAIIGSDGEFKVETKPCEAKVGEL
jgi:hypothetical protein